jgi:hypothetical protein
MLSPVDQGEEEAVDGQGTHEAQEKQEDQRESLDEDED